MYVCVEDQLSLAVAQKLISNYCEPSFVTELAPNQGGYGKIYKNLHAYYDLARYDPVFIISDLDVDGCAPLKRERWFREKNLRNPVSENFIFCFAVREIEAWILADLGSLSRFLNIANLQISQSVDDILDPKQTLIDLARRSPDRELRLDLIPIRNAISKVGIGYNSRLVNFVKDAWCPSEASLFSPSLARAIKRLSALYVDH